MNQPKLNQIHDLLCDAVIQGLRPNDDGLIDPNILKLGLELMKVYKVSALPVPGSKLTDVAKHVTNNTPFPRQVG